MGASELVVGLAAIGFLLVLVLLAALFSKNSDTGRRIDAVRRMPGPGGNTWLQIGSGVFARGEFNSRYERFIAGPDRSRECRAKSQGCTLKVR